MSILALILRQHRLAGRYILPGLLCLVLSQGSWAQAPAPTPDDAVDTSARNSPDNATPQPPGGEMFYHARSTSLNRNLDRYIFEGDVVAIGAGTIITADRIEADNRQRSLTASGHVIILTPKQVFLGEEMIFYWETGDFRIAKALMVANDPKQLEEVRNKVFGFSPEELTFEVKRQERLKRLEARKLALRETYRIQMQERKSTAPDLVDEYALTLEQEDLTRFQENPALSKLSGQRRENFLVRRKYWEASLKRFAAASRKLDKDIYFRIQGEEIQRTNGNDFTAVQANWSPCKCEEGEAPAWGFQADRIEAQVEGYVDLKHPVLQIKGIPVFYLPYLKLPIKQKRQSGFLVPTIRTGNDGPGNVYTQPVYFALAENLDTTITTDVFQERGTRLGAEVRYEQRKHSGWTLNVETIRDRVWIQDRNTREGLLEYHLEDEDGCAQAAVDPCKPEDVRRRLKVPNNTWRGKQEWQGQTFIAPRLSFVSHGTLLSDHRYIGDLFLGDSFEEAFFPASYANAFATARGRFHLDGRDFYLGLGSYFGDFVRTEDRFEGLQVPGALSFQSRTFNLLPRRFILPLYGALDAQYIPIQDFSEDDSLDEPILGSGQWRRVHAGFIAPLVTEGRVRVDYNFDAENRSIHHKPLPVDPAEPDGKTASASWIQSWRTGITFHLPIDGQGEMPEFLQPDDWEEPEKGRRFLHHIMNWSLGFSARPVVVRRGPYGETDQLTGLRQVYFASDRQVHDTNDDAASVEDSMFKHQRITLSTSHRWKTFRRGWQTLEGSAPEDEKPKQEEAYRVRAQRELEFAMDRQISSDSEMFSEEKGLDWFINRYQLTEYDASEPVNFDANISYDFIQEDIRRKQINENRRLEEAAAAEPDPVQRAVIEDAIIPYEKLAKSWTGPNTNLVINWLGFTLSNQVQYDLYLRVPVKTAFALGLPAVLKTRLGFGYTLEKMSNFDPETNAHSLRQTRIRSVAITSKLIPRVNTSISLAKKTVEGDKDKFETRVGFEYYDDSGCWGLRFLRSKDYEDEHERQANYLVQLSIIFMGQQRDQDISAPVQKRYNKEDQ